MKKQRIRIYAALLCSSMVLSLVSTPVSAAETEQMLNSKTTTEELGSLESISGNEAAAVLNGLSVAVLAANSVAEVTTAAELTAALENSANDTVKLMADITIDTTLVVSHTVTLDLNGHILKYENNTVQGSVITVGSGGVLTIQDSDATASHHFTPDGNGLWVLDEVNGTENVSGGIITGGDAPYGGGVYIHDGGKLTMQGGNIVGCKVGGSEGSGGGGVCIKGGTFRMMSGSIIGCLVDIYFAYGGGVWLEGSSSEFIMEGGSIEHCAVNSLTQGYGGGVCATGVAGDLSEGARFTMTGGSITECSVSGHLSGNGGGVGITPELGGRPVFTMSGSAFIDSNTARTVYYSNLLSGDNICISGGIMHANGGTMAASPAGSNNCSLYNYSSGLITGGSSETTIFKGYVVNRSYATISGGKFMDTVLNDGYSCIISGGEFYGAVTNKGTINNGVFYGLVTNTGTINGGSFATLSASDGSTWYPVTFEWNDGTAKVENRHVMENTTVTPPAPARTGYRLAYWYQTDENTAFDFDTPVTRKMTLKAKWARLYAIDVLTEGQGTAQASPTSAAAGDKVTLSVTPHEGYRLKEWEVNPDTLGIEDDNTFTMPEGAVTVKAVFEGIPYSVTLQMNGGTIASGKEVTGYTYGTGAVLPTADDITREGYRFDGWYADSSFSGSPVTEITGTDTGDKVFYAKWMRNTTPIIPGNNTNNIVEQYKTDDSSSGEQTDREVPSPVVKNTTSYMTYTVQAGDTLWAIARKYNCSVTEIVAANSDRIKNPNRIHAGWQLKIPQSGAPITGGTPDAVLPENKKSGIYIVRQGDTLWKIARKYNCSVAEIVSLNRELIRDPALIYSGWELKVPQN